MDMVFPAAISQGCESPAFGKPWFGLSDTRHFRHFRRFGGSDELVLLGREQTRHFRRFRQNPLFSAGGKTTVSQNHRFNNPEFPAQNCGHEFYGH